MITLLRKKIFIFILNHEGIKCLYSLDEMHDLLVIYTRMEFLIFLIILKINFQISLSYTYLCVVAKFDAITRSGFGWRKIADYSMKCI